MCRYNVFHGNGSPTRNHNKLCEIFSYVRYCCCDIALALDVLYNEKISFSYFAIVKYTRNSMQTVSLNKHLKTRLPMTLLFLFLLMVHVGTYTHLSNTRVFFKI